MFSGIVEGVGRAERIQKSRGGMRMLLKEDKLAKRLVPGSSVSVEGVCLTVTGRGGGGVFAVDVVPETLRKTTLGSIVPGSRVNLELPLKVSSVLGGHLVSGHVDGMGRVSRIVRQGSGSRLRIVTPAALMRYVAYKGSVALAGVSLTVAAVRTGAFEVALIPYTLKNTTLGGLRPGRRVNLETDLIAKYVERLLGGRSRQ